MDAETYHRMELEIALDERDRRRAMPAIDASVQSILDVGGGAGQTLIASRLGPQVRAVCLDPDLGALSLGRRLTSDVCFVQGAGERLPFPSASFDMVFSRVALPYMRMRSALPEMARVLRPHGKLWLLLHPFSLVARELVEQACAGDVRAVLHRLYVMANGALANAVGLEIPSPASGRYESFQTAWGMRRELGRLGFDRFEASAGDHFTFSAIKARP